MMCDMRDLIYRAIEWVFICARRLGEPAQLSNELKRRRAILFTRRRRIEIMQSLDVSAHDRPSAIVDSRSTISRYRHSSARGRMVTLLRLLRDRRHFVSFLRTG